MAPKARVTTRIRPGNFTYKKDVAPNTSSIAITSTNSLAARTPGIEYIKTAGQIQAVRNGAPSAVNDPKPRTVTTVDKDTNINRLLPTVASRLPAAIEPQNHSIIPFKTKENIPPTSSINRMNIATASAASHSRPAAPAAPPLTARVTSPRLPRPSPPPIDAPSGRRRWPDRPLPDV